MPTQKSLKFKSDKKAIITLLVIFIIVLLVEISYLQGLKSLINENIYKNLSELGKQNASQIETAITEQKNTVNLIIDYIDKGILTSTDEILEGFKDEIDDFKFTRLIVLDKNGNGKSSDGYEIENYPNIDEIFRKSRNEIYLSENRPSAVEKTREINIYAKTFTLEGEEMLLMATVYSSDYKNLLSTKLFGKGGTYLINAEGTVLIDSFENIQDNTQNLYEYFKTRYNVTEKKEIEKIDAMEKAIKSNQSGTFDVNFITKEYANSKRENYFVHYEKLGINDWYVVTTASDSTIAYEFMEIEDRSTMIAVGFISLVMVVAIVIKILNDRQNKSLYEAAYVDVITGLGNRRFLRESGTVYLGNSSEENNYFITIDIDKFKILNKVYGFAFSNELLKKFGKRLQEILPEENITCRIENDIFGSLFKYNGNIDELMKDLETRISKLIVEDTELRLHVSIGVYKIPEKEKDMPTIIDRSYIARTQAKSLYNVTHYIFDESLERQIIESQDIELNMEQALEDEEFVVYYQPKMNANTEKVAGAEALVRWIRNGEVVSPNKFIPLFEKNKFIIKLDLYIFEKVCQNLVEWRERFGFVPTISINVSKEHFVEENFIDEYVAICKKYYLDPKLIDLEITESATVDERIDVLAIMNKIKDKGFIISLDDFGTGYSSLSMLQSMPIDIIKVDKVFIDKANLDNDNNIINNIMTIAEQLGAKTVIEGVEREEQVEFVKRIHGDIIQGYYYSKPIPKEEFEDYIMKNY